MEIIKHKRIERKYNEPSCILSSALTYGKNHEGRIEKAKRRKKVLDSWNPETLSFRVISAYRFSLRGNYKPGPALGRDTDKRKTGIRWEQRSISIHLLIQQHFIKDDIMS